MTAIESLVRCIQSKMLHRILQRVSKITSSSAIAERDRAAGWVSYGQKWKTVTGRQYFTDMISLSSTTVT